MKFFNKGYYIYPLFLLMLCLFIPGCPPDKEFKFHFSRKDGETYIQRLSVERERHTGETDIQMDDTLAVTMVTCKKSDQGWDIDSKPQSRTMMKDGKEVENPLLDLLADFTITYKVDKDGEIKDITGYDKVQEAINAQYPPGIDEGFTSSLDIEALKQREISEWNGRIGNFINKEFSIGDLWESETPFILPNGVTLTYKVKTHFKEIVQRKNVRCVLIEQTYGDTGEGMDALVKDVAESVSADEGNKKDESLKAGKISTSIKGKVTRLIDPSTMNIYKENAERIIHMEMDVPGSGRIPVKMIETRSYEYEYPD